MTESQIKRQQLEDQLIESSGFQIARDDLCEMFKTENIHPKEGQDMSKSLKLLQQHNFGPAIVQKLLSNTHAGLDGTEADIELRRKIYGPNKRHQRKIRTLCDMLCEVFEDFILKVLCVAAVISTSLGVIKDGWAHGFQEGMGIVFAILIIVIVSVGNDYAKEKKFQELMSQSDVATSTVIRGGNTITLDTEELVVGDIIFIETGKQIPADCLVLEASECSVSEAALTGEPDGLQKEFVNEANVDTAPDPFLLQASELQKGQIKRAVVLAVGNNTNQGRAGLTMNITNEQTPLQKKLDRIAEGIGKLGLLVAILTFIAIVISTLIKTIQDDKKDFDMTFVTAICNGLVIAITVVVVAVPEGLPLAVTISLAFSVAQMQKEENLVRKLQSSETMGNANEICTDKTGTLTQNKMTVQSAYLQDKILDGEVNPDVMQLQSAATIVQAVIMNCSAFIEPKRNNDGQITGEGDVTTGNVTEVGLINYLVKAGADAKAQIAERKAQEPIVSIPFSSARKRATTGYLINNGQTVRIFCKGAPEMVIQSCTQLINNQGEVEELEDDKKDYCINTVVKSYAAKCLRTLLVSYVDYPVNEFNSMKAQANDFKTTADMEILENDLTMVGIFGLKDPLRDGIRVAVEKCNRAGINVRMVTGDNIDTARAISVEAGILTEADLADTENQEYKCMEGAAFREAVGGKVEVKRETIEVKGEDDKVEYKEVNNVICTIENMHVFRKVDQHLKVMARSQPDDKFMLVDGLIKLNKTVAVTGDGTNDAPALNRSDVGFAMGITGTDVAKNACDIQLMNDDFCSILTAIRFGRNIYDNVRKFLQFQLTVNVVAMFIVFAGACLFSEPPLTSTQMLWVNLIMDTFAALALATEPPHESVLDRQPAHRGDAIVNAVMWRNIVGQSIYQIIVLLVLMFKGGDIFNIAYEQSDPFYPTGEQVAENPLRGWVEQEPTNKVLMYTIIFQAFVFMQLFNQINSRKLGERDYNVFADFFNNWLFIVITIITFAVQVVAVMYGDRYMRCVPLSTEQNLYCAAIGVFCIPYGLLLKFVPSAWFSWIKLEETEMEAEEEQGSIVAALKKSHTKNFSKKAGSLRSGTQNFKQVDQDDGYKIN